MEKIPIESGLTLAAAWVSKEARSMQFTLKLYRELKPLKGLRGEEDSVIRLMNFHSCNDVHQLAAAIITKDYCNYEKKNLKKYGKKSRYLEKKMG